MSSTVEDCNFKRRFLHFLSSIWGRSGSFALSHGPKLIPVNTWNPNTILVIMLTHLGDVVLNLFILDSISARFGAKVMDVVVKPPVDQVVRSHSGVRKVIPFPCPWVGASNWRHGLGEWLRTIHTLRQNDYDLVVVTHPHELNSLTAMLTGARVTVGWAFGGDSFLDFPLCVPGPPDRHASEYGVELLGFLGITRASKPVRIPVCEEDFRRGKALVEMIGLKSSESGCKAVVIHPGAGGRKKIWPKENFIAVIDHLLAWGHTVALVGGEAENRICADIEKAFSHQEKLENFSGQLNVGELAGAFSAADIYIGNDSGPSHVAGALGIKSCVIFGPASDPVVWAPRGAGVSIVRLRDEEFESASSVGSVLATVECLLNSGVLVSNESFGPVRL